MCIRDSTKGFEVVFFSVNVTLIDDENVHKGLKINTFLKTSLFIVKVGLFQKSVFCRFKSFKIEYLKVKKTKWL